MIFVQLCNIMIIYFMREVNLFNPDEMIQINKAFSLIKLINAIEMGLRNFDDRMIYLVYPNEISEIESQFDKASRKTILEARTRIVNKLQSIFPG